jgi:glucoside 3-dehydrogenase (cytochrome c) hitch-hiker subunit
MSASANAQPNRSKARDGTDLIGRRKALQLLGIAGIGSAFIKASGGTIAYGAVDAPLAAPARLSNSLPEQDFLLLRRIVEIIIPKTDTAGAIEAGVPEFVDSALVTMSGTQLATMSGSADIFTDNPQVLFADGLLWIGSQARERKGRDFMDLAESDQVSLLESLFAEAETVGAMGRGAQFLKSLKTLTVSAYYTSEEGLLKELGYKGNKMLMGFRLDCDPKLAQ